MTAVSLVSLVGLVFLTRDRAWLDQVMAYLVSLAAGVLLGGAVVHLLPRAIDVHGSNLSLSLWFLVGFLGFFVLERTLWTHTHEVSDEALGGHAHGVAPPGNGQPPPAHRHPPTEPGPAPPGHAHPLVMMNLLGDGIHNLIDGMVIAAAFAADVSLGMVTTLAVLLHEVPQEIGDFGVLIYGGLSVKKALLFNFLSAAMAIVGAVITLAVGTHFQGLLDALVPITAGNFMYIAAADLIPELHREHTGREGFLQAAVLVAGVGLMIGLRFLEPLLG